MFQCFRPLSICNTALILLQNKALGTWNSLMKNSRFSKMHHYAAFCKSGHMCVWVHVSVCLCVMYSELEIRIGLKVGTFYRLLLASPLRVCSTFVLANWI